VSRPREFEETAVLDRAMPVFWRQGYGATSMKDIEKATGLNPGSLYLAFGGKHALFLRVLDHYIEKIIYARIRTYLSGGYPPLEGLRRFVWSAVDYVQPDLPGYSCLVVNTAVEMGRTDPEILARITAAVKRIEKAATGELQRAVELGELPPSTDAKALARRLLTGFQGLLVMSRVVTDRKTLRVYADGLLGERAA